MSTLQEILDEFSRGGLRNFRLAVEELDAHGTRRAFQEHPEIYAKLLQVSAVDALHRTLKSGHPDELSWAELEDVCRRLGGQPLAFSNYPYLVVTNGETAVVLDTQRPICEHRLDLPEGARLAGMRWCDGQLQVAYVDEDDQLQGYWSGSPGEVRPFTAEDCWLVKPGDTRLPRPERLISDGRTVWSPEGRRVDPATGRAGERSLPEFFQNFPGLDLSCSWLVPTNGCPEAPLGAKDGLSGWRCRRLDDGGLEAETIDGRRVKLPADAPLLEVEPMGLLRLPGSEVLLSGFNGGYCFYDLEGWPLFFFGMDEPYPQLGLPHLFWNSMTVADASVSAWLRTLTRQDCQKMYDAENPVPDFVRHPGLHHGVLDSVQFARRFQERLTRLLEQRSPASSGEVPLSEELLQKALFVFAPWVGVSPPGAVLDVESSIAYLRGGPAPSGSPTSVLWWVSLPYLKALAWRAAAPFTPGTEREVLLRFLEIWARLDLAPRTWRVLLGSFERSSLPWPAAEGVAFGEYRGSRYLISSDQDGFALEVAAHGECQNPPGINVDVELLPDPWATPERLLAVVDLVKSRGPLATHPEVVDELCARSGLPDPLMKLIWAGAPHFYEALPPKLLKRLMLDPRDGMEARRYLAQPYVLGQLLGSFFGAEPAQLWDAPLSAAPRLAATWEDLTEAP